jgi:hypothetical protein
MASTLTRFESSRFLPVGTRKTLVYAARVGNEEAPHHRTVDVCQTIRNYPGIFEWMRRSMSRRALNLVEDILSTYCKCTLSAITHKLNVSGYMFIWTFFLVLVCGTRAQSSHLSDMEKNKSVVTYF